MRLSIHEVLLAVSNAKDQADRVAVLRKNDSAVLRQILQIGFNPLIKFNLPEGAPPFKTDRNLPIGMADTNLFQEARRLYIFIEGRAPAGLKRAQRETLYINLLEGLHCTEADMIVALKDKALEARYPGLDVFTVFQAFPGLIPEPTFIAPDPFIGVRGTTPLGESMISAPYIPNAPKIVARGEVAKSNPLAVPAKKPVNPKKVEACRKASIARSENARLRREAKALAESQAMSQD